MRHLACVHIQVLTVASLSILKFVHITRRGYVRIALLITLYSYHACLVSESYESHAVQIIFDVYGLLSATEGQH